MSCLTAHAPHRAGVPRNFWRGAVGVVSTVVVYVLILMSAGAETFRGIGLVTAGVEHLGPQASATADGATAFGQDAARVLDRIHTLAPWPLMALTLAWPAHRDPARYARTAFALLLSSAAGVAALISSHGLPASQTSLLRDYLALPGVGASWYVLTALAVAATVVRPRVRLAVLLAALSTVAWEVLASDSRPLAALPAVGTPVVAWFVVGVPVRQRARPGRAVSAARAAAPEAGAVAFRSRAETVEPWAGAPVPRSRRSPSAGPRRGHLDRPAGGTGRVRAAARPG